MSIRYLTPALLAALLLWPAALSAQSPELRDAYTRMNDLYAEGR